MDTLEKLAAKAWAWFERNRNPATGLVRDKGSDPDVASIAATGYYLSVLPEAVERGWVSPADARQQIGVTLAFARKHVAERHGIFCHFVHISTGARHAGSEFSTLDTAIFLNGCMVASRFVAGLADEADSLVGRAEWHRYVRGGLLSLGWNDKDLPPGRERTSEMAMPYFLAVGSEKVGAEVWYNTEARYGDLGGQRLYWPQLPLFCSHMGLGWMDLSGRYDGAVDLEYWARHNALGQREYLRGLPHLAYRMGFWGVSAGEHESGYIADGPDKADGTVWPLAALAAAPWAPAEIEHDISVWSRTPFWDKINGPYGLLPFNADRGWFGKEYIGIDLGGFLVNLANLRNNTVRELWMSHPVARRAVSDVYRSGDAQTAIQIRQGRELPVLRPARGD